MEKKNRIIVNKTATVGGTVGRTVGGMTKSGAKSVGEALLKAALGCRIAEVTEEYAEVDGELKLLKRKKTKKDIPPDLKAVQLLLETGTERDISALSDEELEEEKQRLLRLLYESGNSGKTTDDEASQEKTADAKKPVAKKPVARKSARKSAVRKAGVRKKSVRKKSVRKAAGSGSKAAEKGATDGKEKSRTECETNAEDAEKK